VTTYRKIWQSETEYKIEQRRDDEIVRWVDEDHGQYVAWLALGNTPEEVAYVAPEPVEPEPKPQIDRLADIEAALLDLAEAIL
jgi:hypothetical protein